jgi:hypothetical protein
VRERSQVAVEREKVTAHPEKDAGEPLRRRMAGNCGVVQTLGHGGDGAHAQNPRGGAARAAGGGRGGTAEGMGRRACADGGRRVVSRKD